MPRKTNFIMHARNWNAASAEPRQAGSPDHATSYAYRSLQDHAVSTKSRMRSCVQCARIPKRNGFGSPNRHWHSLWPAIAAVQKRLTRGCTSRCAPTQRFLLTAG